MRAGEEGSHEQLRAEGMCPWRMQRPGTTRVALCCRSRAAPATPETARPPTLRTAGVGQSIDEHLQTSTSQPRHGRGSAGRRGKTQGVPSPNQCSHPLARP